MKKQRFTERPIYNLKIILKIWHILSTNQEKEKICLFFHAHGDYAVHKMIYINKKNNNNKERKLAHSLSSTIIQNTCNIVTNTGREKEKRSLKRRNSKINDTEQNNYAESCL